jgi:phosphatidate cytidylyltransferase
LKNTTGETVGLEALKMKKRIISAAVLVPLLLLILFAAPKWATAVLFSVVTGLAAFELTFGTGLVKHPRLMIYTVLVAFAMPLWCNFGMNPLWGNAGLLLFVLLMFMEMMLSNLRLKLSKVAICFVGGILLPYLLSSIVRIMALSAGRYLILIPFVVAFMSDTGAYFVGCRFGKHKLAPEISPNKSVEGVFGGMAFAMLSMLLYCLILSVAFKCKVNYAFAIIYGLVGSIAGVFGDLCFSVIKRQTGIKDYGNLIPGHGGALDRFDSMHVVAPLMELLLMVLPVVVK